MVQGGIIVIRSGGVCFWKRLCIYVVKGYTRQAIREGSVNMKGHSVDIFKNISQMALALRNVHFYTPKKLRARWF